MGICENCGKDCIKHAKGMCVTCYKRLVWKPKLVKCPRCKRMLPMKAKGLCGGCYNSTFFLEKTKDYQNQKNHNIPIELYKQLTKKCLICGFDKYVVLHHLDKNRKNTLADNLIGLCPNHHQLIHTLKYRDEIQKQVDEALEKIKQEIPTTKEENSSE